MKTFPHVPMYSKAQGFAGTLTMGVNADGEPEPVRFTPPRNDERTLLALIHDCVPEKAEILPSDWAEGFAITMPGERWTAFTAYVGSTGLSLYRAIPDLAKGIDIEDEQPITVNANATEFLSALREAVMS